ncbi:MULTISPECIES: preprotein translocase subunit SecE [Kosmotoga]|uniref:Protein translocase subunit SecE n=1 Tax=Kosmotoga olearia (strain ATCC BAA-1733 / DSM 21960 / TBF 19.5.1) TaxID=521045 RepID=C5CGE5_KOSOT|nr:MULTISPECIES: preprotein translocase subunit SecE [Kosmotoga]ACR80526.1 preprotein translocase, SecE subunit [Kosmotoga olearia TBF 19.5.1]MDI3523343.1 preprotein translocase subunit SecE [Kosmotoga sp.]MDK2953565.1 preprotein translocase subunit SecE [Kosmotoga sp.]
MAQKSFWRFITEVRQETKKVTWPNRKQLLSTTGAVMVVLLVCGIFLGLLDIIFTNVIGDLLKFLTGGL